MSCGQDLFRVVTSQNQKRIFLVRNFSGCEQKQGSLWPGFFFANSTLGKFVSALPTAPFNNPVCLQGRVTPPCFGSVGGGQKRLLFYEHLLSGVSLLTREGTILESRRTWTRGQF